MKIENVLPGLVKHTFANLCRHGAGVLDLYMLLQILGENPLIRGDCGRNKTAPQNATFR